MLDNLVLRIGGRSSVLLQISGSKASNKPQGMKMKAE